MDPLSVAASVVGVLGAATKVSEVLTNFIRGAKDAPALASGVLHEVSDIQVCLTQLQSFLLGTKVGERSRTALIMVEQVVVTLTSCVMTFSELEEALEPLKDRTLEQVGNRFAWMWKQNTLSRLCLRLNSNRQSLNLMLTILTCVSAEQATSSVEKLTTLVHQVIQQNEDLRSRIGSLKCEPQNQGRWSASSIREEQQEADDASTIRLARPGVTAAINPHEIAVKSFAFERDLGKSRVYIRAMRRISCDSLQTSDAPSFGWSCFSETSLAEVSNVSVISLPIALDELSNGKHYQSSSNTEVPSPVPAPFINAAPAASGVVYPKQIIILGNSLSGKTTICRQIQAMGGRKLSDSQVEDARQMFFLDLISASLLLYNNIGADSIAFSDVVHARKVLDTLELLYSRDRRAINVWEHSKLIFSYLQKFGNLFRSSDVRHLLSLEDQDGLYDNIEFLSNRLLSSLASDFKPTNIDLFHIRPESTKQPTIENCMINDVRYQLIDVCGIRCERYITSGLFGVHCVIFAVALSGYCRRLLNSPGINRMKDAMRTFSEICAMVSVPIVLFFTKYDVLEKKLKTHSFQNYFPDYTGSETAFEICEYFAIKFRRLDLRPDGILTMFVVNATDPGEFHKVSMSAGIFTAPPRGFNPLKQGQFQLHSADRTTIPSPAQI